MSHCTSSIWPSRATKAFVSTFRSAAAPGVSPAPFCSGPGDGLGAMAASMPICIKGP